MWIGLISYGQTTRELFSLSGLRYGIVYRDSYENYKQSNHSYFYNGDTVINNTTLLRYSLYRYTSTEQFLEVIDKKVYLYEHTIVGEVPNSKELIYDFGLGIGDTFYIPGEGNFKAVQKEVLSYEDNIKRTYIKLRSLSGINEFEWIEGIGEIKWGPFSNNYHHSSDLKFICSESDKGKIISIDDDLVECSSLFCKNAVANFNYSTNHRTVQFFNKSLHSVEWAWDFGDGTQSSEANPFHNYNEPGCKTVTLTCTDACGDSSILSKNINYCMQGDWEVNNNLGFTSTPKDVTILDSMNIKLHHNNKLWSSKNGGVSFDNIHLNLEEKEQIVNTIFEGDKILVLTRIFKNFKYILNTYYSENLGSNWLLTWSGLGYIPELISRPNTKTIILYDIGKSYFKISADLGITWGDTIATGPDYLNKFTVLDPNTLCYIKQKSLNGSTLNEVFFTVDKGISWDSIILPTYKDIQFINDKYSILINENNEILISQDFFKNITNTGRKTPIEGPYPSIFFQNSSEGFYFGNEGEYFTADGGYSWVSTDCLNNDLSEVKLDHSGSVFAYDKSSIYRFTQPNIDDACIFSQTDHDNKFNQNIGIFPNPIIEGSYLNVFNKDDIILTAEIYNNTGQLIQSRKNIINSLDTSNLGKGYYLLSLKTPDGLLIKNIGFVVL